METMKFRILIASWFCALLVGLSGAAAETQWVEDFAQAKKLAQKESKDLLINISGSDWCIWCQRLDQEVFDQDAFRKQAQQDYILVKLDFPRNKPQAPEIKEQNQKLRKQFEKDYGIPGFPTVFLADAQGKAYARTGYQAGGAEAYLKHMAALKDAKPLIDPGAEWLQNHAVAKAKAAALKKDILINFSGSDWCGWCIRLDKEVFDQEYFKTEAPKDFVLLKLDYPRRTPQDPEIKAQNAKLAQEYSSKYNFQGYPSVYLAGPNGEPYNMTGYEAGGPEKYIQNLREMKKNKESKK